MVDREIGACLVSVTETVGWDKRSAVPPDEPRRFRWDCAALVPPYSFLCLAASLLIGFAGAAGSSVAGTPSSGTSAAAERFWLSIADREPPDTMSLRHLFVRMRALAESRRHPERMERLLALAARAQDRNPNSPTFGNFRWLWRDAGVTDPNAVEFLMQDAAATWIKHKEWMPEEGRARFRELIGYAVEACLRHRVPVSYTNIAILNAGNVAVLGEVLDRPDVALEGYRRLEALCAWTWAFGLSEFCSPTYYGVDLDGLEFLLAFARRESGRQQAAALRELVWTDIALNYFPAAEKLAGSHSRSYDYLRGIGSLDAHLEAAGWLQGEVRERQSQWFAQRPEDLVRLRQLAQPQLPRVVRQRWGMPLCQSRTHALYPDVTLSCSASAYFNQDVPLTVDLAGDRSLPRCYFIADGREDPYGKSRVETGMGRHLKAIHLVPFWTAAQRNRDAIGLAIYRRRDLEAGPFENLQSHMVLRRPTEGLWLAGQRVEIRRTGFQPVPANGMGRRPILPALSSDDRVPVEANVPIVLRYGTAAVGIRLLWSRAQDGRPAPAALVDDGNRFGVIRLTVEHRRDAPAAEAGAALWIRIGSGLAGHDAFERWRKRFENAAPPVVEATDRLVRLEVPGEEGPVSMVARAPFGLGGTELRPEPTRAVLELDGKEVGRPVLEAVEPILSLCRGRNPLSPIHVPAEGSVSWEAEAGMALHGMTIADDAAASQGRCVFQPPAGEVYRLPGSVTWSVSTERPGRYYLWARVLAPDPQSNSFHVSWEGDAGEILARDAWHLREGGPWNWQCLALGKSKTPTPIDLLPGLSWLQFRTRESGTKIDRLLLTPNANARPE